MPSEFLGGDVGLAINACLFLTGALQYGMRQSAEAENLMCSVERVMEYGDLKCENYSSAIENKVNESMFQSFKFSLSIICTHSDHSSYSDLQLGQCSAVIGSGNR